ncbi:hypothetical protein FSP39_008332 [Pinctada imbricata]|uniref:Uncharacterized protein n=1 Tax=Pinctada imbricata TaxID=66713 RepID=A0AA88YDH5_PINIB|nr:hypothetical protein FSP39_023649 [Pinctada imbricata]KAK3097282.1 hypothetical protein FSP39_008332 [Pinctada imbricata]
MDDSNVVTFKTSEQIHSASENEVENLDENEDMQHSENVNFSLHRQISDLGLEMRENLRSVTSEIRDTMCDFRRDLAAMQHQIDSMKRRDVTPIIPRSLNLNRNQNESPQVRQSTPNHNGNGDDIFRSRSQTRKMKAQTYNGEEDLEEYLAQFEIVSEINGWDYETKSLYLASSLTGGARALLSELDDRQRRDYESLVEVLKTRFGCENRAEVFKSKLQTRVRGKDEKIPELAQSVKKLTRKAYPSASSDVVDVLAVDYFIDALNDADIRLRLREIGPKSLSEAEKIAVRLEAHRIADKSKGRLHVKSVEFSEPQSEREAKKESDLEKMQKQMSDLVKEIKDMRGQNCQGQGENFRGREVNRWNRGPMGQNNNVRERGANMNDNRNFQNRNQRFHPRFNQGQGQAGTPNNRQLNREESRSRDGARQNYQSPRMN